jgi:predicted permease
MALFTGSITTSPVRVPGSTVDSEHDPDIMRNWISSDYFQTLGIGLRLGRAFTERDNRAGPKVGIINETAARRYFGQESPIGRVIYFPKQDGQGRYIPFPNQLDPEQGVQIVGVVQDTKINNLREGPLTAIYFPIAQEGGFGQSVEVRTVDDPKALESQLPRVLREVNRGLAIGSMKSIEEQIDTTLSFERLAARLLGFFGSLALVLASVGLYGVMSYAVARRTGEIGIRMAMGAGRAAVVSMIVRQTVLLVTAGVALGVPAALASTHLLTALLFGLKPTDPATISTTVALMLTIAVLAGYIPARRAARVDPMTALRHE